MRFQHRLAATLLVPVRTARTRQVRQLGLDPEKLETCSCFRASQPIQTAEPLKPAVRAESYGTEGIAYTVRYWVPRFSEDIDCRDAMLVAVDEAIRKEGLSRPMGRIKLVALRDQASPLEEASPA